MFGGGSELFSQATIDLTCARKTRQVQIELHEIDSMRARVTLPTTSAQIL